MWLYQLTRFIATPQTTFLFKTKVNSQTLRTWLKLGQNVGKWTVCQFTIEHNDGGIIDITEWIDNVKVYKYKDV